MTITSYTIRVCNSCGLRYPLLNDHPHGERCPICMGSTRIVLNRKLTLEPEPDRPSTSRRRKNSRVSVLLDNVRSAWNVGSIFRSADGFGFTHAYLCGITPTPENPAVTKTSLGAEDTVTWSYHKDAVQLAKGLKKESFVILALEESPNSEKIKTLKPNQNVVLVVGNENMGVDPELLELCEAIYHIPMRGEKKSFNVAMAFSIAAYALMEK